MFVVYLSEKKIVYADLVFFFKAYNLSFFVFNFWSSLSILFSLSHSPSSLIWSMTLSSSFIFFFLFISYFSFFKLVRCFFSRVSFLYLFNFMFVLFFFMVCTAIIFFSISHFCYLTTLMFCYSHNNLLSTVLFDDIEDDCTWKSTCPINSSSQILLFGQGEHFKSKLFCTLKYLPSLKKSANSLSTFVFKTIHKCLIKTHVKSSFIE